MSASDDKSDAIYTASYTKPAIKRLTKQKTNLRESCKQMVDEMIRLRKKYYRKIYLITEIIAKSIFLVAFEHIINNVQGQQFINVNSMVDITPFEAFQLIDAGYQRLEKIYICETN